MEPALSLSCFSLVRTDSLVDPIGGKAEGSKVYIIDAWVMKSSDYMNRSVWGSWFSLEKEGLLVTEVQ